MNKSAPVRAVEQQPFRVVLRVKVRSGVDESLFPSIELARSYFGADNEVPAERIEESLSVGEWSAIPVYLAPAQATMAAASAAVEPAKVQDIMFEVYEYAKMVDGFDDLAGDRRAWVRNDSAIQAAKIRKMITAFAIPTPEAAQATPAAVLVSDEVIGQLAYSVWGTQVNRLPVPAALKFARLVLALAASQPSGGKD